MISEFSIIDKYFKKLASNSASLGLEDDCAIFFNKAHSVINSDTLIENSHFFSQDAPESIATKMLAVNLSDIASMGAVPKYWLLNLSINSKFVNHQWLNAFSKASQAMQDLYSIALIGGDTTFTTGAMVISVTLIASIDKNHVLYQNTAQEGEYIYVSNSIGDAYYGYQILKNYYQHQIDLYPVDKEFLKMKYLYPQAQVKLGQCLAKYATSCTDISDGLLADLEKLCLKSQVRGVLSMQDMYNKIFSSPVKQIIASAKNVEQQIITSITGGDDYELIFTLKKSNAQQVEHIVADLGYTIHKIGETTAYKNSALMVKGLDNQEFEIKVAKGFEHKF